MEKYQELIGKLINAQLNKVKSAVKKKTELILRMNKKYEDQEFVHILFLATRRTTKIRNDFANNMSTDGTFASQLANLGKKALKNVVIPSARDNLSGLESNLFSKAINKSKRKTSGKGAVRAGKRFTLFISNEDINDIIKIIKSLEDSNVLFDGITETVKHEIKNNNTDLFLLC